MSEAGVGTRRPSQPSLPTSWRRLPTWWRAASTWASRCCSAPA